MLDDFASNYRSPAKQPGQFERQSVQSTITYQKGNHTGQEKEWDRLMKEREELLRSGVYGKEDILIRELDRQINDAQAAQ